jgi:nickel-dependent lactate racemase
MALYLALGAPDVVLSDQQLRDGLRAALDALGVRRRVLAIPPDITRFHSRAGDLTRWASEYYGRQLNDILPALGTHAPMTAGEISRMYPGVPHELFRVHDWRNAIVTLGEVPAAYIHEQSEGQLNYSWPAQVNRLLLERPWDLILSLGQVVPHEVIGMANYNKNILIGTGGLDGIHRSHFLGAVYGMERIMGRADNPVRRVLNRAADEFLTSLPIVYALTVVGTGADGQPVTRGLFVGDDVECFLRASALSLEVNFRMLDEPIRKAVVYLEPHEFKTTWLGNKSIYRTRMALADDAELIVLAPGVERFGEDPGIDALIRRFGYHGTPATLAAVREHPDLAASLGAAAHLIHSASEGRFRITYCPGHMTREEVESVGFGYAQLDAMMEQYGPGKLREGRNQVGGEDVFYISNPGLGLWAHRARFEAPAPA